jgi:hypothetical protein
MTPEEIASLRAWFAEYDAAQWDRQFEADVKAGKLDAMASEAFREFQSRKPTN